MSLSRTQAISFRQWGHIVAPGRINSRQNGQSCRFPFDKATIRSPIGPRNIPSMKPTIGSPFLAPIIALATPKRIQKIKKNTGEPLFGLILQSLVKYKDIFLRGSALKGSPHSLLVRFVEYTRALILSSFAPLWYTFWR